MSLQFIFGNSGSGKSHYLYEHITKESMKYPNYNYIVLVPEQFTMQTQKELVMRHPRHGIMNIDVLSFARLAFRVFEETGAGREDVLDDEGKNLILRKIAGKLEPSLKVLKGNLKKPGYISEVKSVISELTQYNIGPEGMDTMLDAVPEESYLYYKLQDIQTVYQAFEEFLEDKYITKEELLDVLCSAAARSDILKNSVVALDGFTGFTPVQNKVLREMMKHCRKVFITVTIDGREDPYVLEDKYRLFSMSKQMVTSLVRIAKEENIWMEEAVTLFEKPLYRFRENAPLAFLESELFRYGNKKYNEKQDAVRIYCARNPQAEVAAAAQRIRALVRIRGYRYRDIAVIASNMDNYADEIEIQFEKYGIPVFLDYKRNVLQNAFVEYVRSILAMAEQNYSAQSVFRFLRTGLAGFTQDETDRLENYVTALGIRGYKKWQEKWVRRTKSMDREELLEVNHLRVRFVEMMDALAFVLRQKRKTVRDITEALYEFFVRQEMQKKLKEREELFIKNGEPALAKEYAQIYRIMIELFDKFVGLLGDEWISVREYARLLDAGLEEARVGVIPPSIDEVTAGDIERTRLRDVKALLMLGLNDTLIPGAVLNGGLLSERDRERFEDKQIALAPGAKEKTYIQKFYLYLHMTKPTMELDLFYSKVSSDGKSLRPAYLIHDIQKMFPGIRTFDMESYGISYMEMTPKTGIDYVIRGIRDPQTARQASWQELYRWYMENPKFRDGVRLLVEAGGHRRRQENLKSRTAEELYGGYEPSVTRLEQFSACACAHFLAYGLKLKEREEYEFAALDFGNVFHRSLEHYAKKIEENKEEWTTLSKETRQKFVEESVEESIVDYSNTVLYSSARSAYMIPRMKRMLSRTVWALTCQLERGDFKPEGYEVSFGSGKIDRIDTYDAGEKIYVKVLDYKTGAKAFDMAAFYHGLQMQLVVYMAEALKLEERKYPGKKAVPAGIFYYRMKDPIVDKEIDEDKLQEAILRELKLDGLVNGDDAVVRRLDREFDGNSSVIPVARTKNGYSKTSKTLSPEEFGKVLDYAEEKRTELKNEIKEGMAEANPFALGQQTGCDFCKFKDVCGFDEQLKGYEYRRLSKMSREEVIGAIQKKTGKGGTRDGDSLDKGTTTSH